MTDKNTDRQFVTALARGLQLLRCFTPTQRELRTSDIARLTGLPQPTVWRLCHTLLELGYLAPSVKNDRLQLGIGVLSLGYATLATLDIYDAFRPQMQAIADKYKAAVSLALRDNLEMVYVQRCHSDSMMQMNLRKGSRVPMINTSLGWAYLSVLDDASRSQLEKSLADSNPELWKSIKPKLQLALRDNKKSGYVLNIGSFWPELNAVAVPIVSEDGNTILTLNCSGFASMLSPQTLEREVVSQLLDIATTIRMALPQFAHTD